MRREGQSRRHPTLCLYVPVRPVLCELCVNSGHRTGLLPFVLYVSHPLQESRHQPATGCSVQPEATDWLRGTANGKIRLCLPEHKAYSNNPCAKKRKARRFWRCDWWNSPDDVVSISGRSIY